VTAPSFGKVMRILQANHADPQDFLRATGCLPKNTEPVALGKMRKIPVISWVAAGRWTETGETLLEEDVIEWIKTEISESLTLWIGLRSVNDNRCAIPKIGLCSYGYLGTIAID